ncbi:glycosyltransferase [Desulfurococcaceae archaeon MEX13E-LK6-19]|nr:glycosyltransferase [Desulfurococcaceae archaeon MEX13E-LK6-19]
MDEELNKKVTVIVPTYNEEEGIGKVIDELIAEGFSKENIIVVDGHSTDKTVEIAKSKGVKVIYQEGHGKGDAIRTGLKYVKTPYVAVIDGDYTYPAKHIKDLLHVAENGGWDEVIGARIYGRKNIPLINRLGNYVLTKLFNILFGTKLRDVLSGLYIIRKEKLASAMFETKGFSIESEIAAHIASTTGKIIEHPISYRRRVGEKKLRILDGIRIGIDMIRLAWRYNPAFVLFSAGAIILVPGLLLGGYVAYYYLFHGIKYYVKGLIALIMTLAGFQSLLIAILSVYLKRMEWRLTSKIETLQERISALEKKRE